MICVFQGAGINKEFHPHAPTTGRGSAASGGKKIWGGALTVNRGFSFRPGNHQPAEKVIFFKLAAWKLSSSPTHAPDLPIGDSIVLPLNSERRATKW